MKAMEALTRLVVGTSRFGDHLLKKKFSGVVVAALAFACGASLVCALRREPPATPAAPSYNSAEDAARAPFDPACYDEAGRDTAGLEEWKNRNNGAALRLDYDLTSGGSDVSDAKVVMLPAGGSLTGAGGVLYMLDAGGLVVWKYAASQRIADFVYVAPYGTVYLTTGDGRLHLLDAKTGVRVLSAANDARGGYRAVLPYGGDSCLVVEGHAGYRTDCHGGHRPTEDGVAVWRGTRIIGRAAVPADAELQVVGSKIFAVTKTRSRILVREIKAPPGGL